MLPLLLPLLLVPFPLLPGVDVIFAVVLVDAVVRVSTSQARVVSVLDGVVVVRAVTGRGRARVQTQVDRVAAIPPPGWLDAALPGVLRPTGLALGALDSLDVYLGLGLVLLVSLAAVLGLDQYRAAVCWIVCLSTVLKREKFSF